MSEPIQRAVVSLAVCVYSMTVMDESAWLAVFTLIDDARERALLGVDLNRIYALQGENLPLVGHWSASRF